MDDLSDSNRFLPESLKQEIKRNELCTDIVVSYLVRRKKGKGKINQLLLDMNKIDMTLDLFMESQNTLLLNYAKTLKKTETYHKLQLTDRGFEYYRNNQESRYNVKFPTLIHKIKRYTLKFIEKFWSFVFVSANNKIKIMMNSGIAKLILFITSLIIAAAAIKALFFN